MQAAEPTTRDAETVATRMAVAYEAAEQGDYARALEIWGPLAHAGVVRAQSNIGACFANGLGVAILSTPKGVMSDSRARTENVGGEILCNVF